MILLRHILALFYQRHVSALIFKLITFYFFLNKQSDPLIIQIHFVIKLYMFRALSLPIIRSSLLYMRHW